MTMMDKVFGALVDNQDGDLKRCIDFHTNCVNSANGIDDSGKRESLETGAIREPDVGKGRFDLISPFAEERIAKWYELGARKYSDRNWEKGIKFSRYLNSAKRHINKFLKGKTDEDHLAAACWNLMAIMHHQECNQMHLDDLPHYENNMKDGD